MKYSYPIGSDLERKYKAMRANKPCLYDTFSDYLHSFLDIDFSEKAKGDNVPMKPITIIEREDK